MKKDIHDLKKIVADMLQDDKRPVPIAETPSHFFGQADDLPLSIHPVEKAVPIDKDSQEDSMIPSRTRK